MFAGVGFYALITVLPWLHRRVHTIISSRLYQGRFPNQQAILEIGVLIWLRAFLLALSCLRRRRVDQEALPMEIQ
jgi:hypothetical protein